ncbi:AAA family ATPase [Paenibacillus sp. GCM10023248]|uniref:AAA family ATPase n=1 Tax=unclassified Paenibacillus TaxID=185978 RepID=UPI0023795033|nr:AAA family ATPase [Paenibacillus sp. MAHUQ-63]MDD9271365.1 AAA family ATPase [Paenibacillus sp. MAHUQ-63]
MSKPLFVIINGLPGTGKTTLAKRLAQDVRLPLFSRDGLYETLYEAMECQHHGCPENMAPAAFALLYEVAGTLLSAGQSLVTEGFFGRPELRSAEFLKLRKASDFQPLQIMCQADGEVILSRYLQRMGRSDRHEGHRDLEWLEQPGNRERLLAGRLAPMQLGGTLIEIDTTTQQSFDYEKLLERVRAASVKS